MQNTDDLNRYLLSMISGLQQAQRKRLPQYWEPKVTKLLTDIVPACLTLIRRAVATH